MPVLIDYFIWHYTRALKEAFHVWFNLVWFDVHLFSIPQLLGSLFAPFRRITEERTRKWDFEEMMSALVVNLISRLLGALLRLIFIMVGLAGLLFLLIGIVLFYLLWLAAPVVVTFIFGYGVFLLV